VTVDVNSPNPFRRERFKGASLGFESLDDRMEEMFESGQIVKRDEHTSYIICLVHHKFPSTLIRCSKKYETLTEANEALELYPELTPDHYVVKVVSTTEITVV